MSQDSATADGGSEQRYFQFLAAGQFRVQQCTACRRHIFPPREFCPACDGEAPAWAEVSGLGTIHTYTVVARKADQGGPYNVVLVDLDEGVRLMSTVLHLPPEQLAVGLRLQAEVEGSASGARVVFRRIAP